MNIELSVKDLETTLSALIACRDSLLEQGSVRYIEGFAEKMTDLDAVIESMQRQGGGDGDDTVG